jgi:uncharacterized protein (UPF0276 family)
MPYSASHSLPNVAGIGLRAQHYEEVLRTVPSLGWVEVHSENFFGGGASLHTLLRVREHFPVSLHGVGMGLASSEPLDARHLSSLRQLCDRVDPSAVSEHLSWNTIGGKVINDLLPFPYTQASLSHVAKRVDQVQEVLGRRLLVENLSSYLCFSNNEMNEGEFLAALSLRTGCGILFDVNNLYVNAVNLGINPKSYIQALPRDSVMEYHLAGHSLRDGCLVDTHSTQVCEEVWDLYEYALQQIGRRPTLIEWDNDIPSLSVLRNEASKAGRYLERNHVCMA